VDNTEIIAGWIVACEVYAKRMFSSDEHASMVSHIRRIRRSAQQKDELADNMVLDVQHMCQLFKELAGEELEGDEAES